MNSLPDPTKIYATEMRVHSNRGVFKIHSNIGHAKQSIKIHMYQLNAGKVGRIWWLGPNGWELAQEVDLGSDPADLVWFDKTV